MNRFVPLGLVMIAAAFGAVYAIRGDFGNGELETAATGPVAKFEFTAPAPAPDNVAFVDGGGNPLTLNDFKGQTLLLNLWATWCTPCLEEMPSLDALQRDMGSDDFQVVALSVDKDGTDADGAEKTALAKVEDFFADNEIRHLTPYVDDTGRAATFFGAVGMPTTYLISPDGMVLGNLAGKAEWDSEEAKTLIRKTMEAQSNTGS